ncbi:hypothetical protein [Dyella telluris]|uniref:Uncharacterized protein n=1 Tax=Dyella telluris TaxID=2763498 RepID=A0A7G8Q4P9_9GAMM|nr:hypothetical protein [Dyella telluris]QNK01757.1 hypothetical protein H8F01_00825 [Dyella telluris]
MGSRSDNGFVFTQTGDDHHCDEPHHTHLGKPDERAHKLHHWKERLMCMGFCTILHFILEAIRG